MYFFFIPLTFLVEHVGDTESEAMMRIQSLAPQWLNVSWQRDVWFLRRAEGCLSMLRCFQPPRLWRRFLLSLQGLRTQLKPAPAARSHSQTPLWPRSLTQTPGSRWRNATDRPLQKQRCWYSIDKKIYNLDQLLFQFSPLFMYFTFFSHVLHSLSPSVFSRCPSLLLPPVASRLMICVFSAPLLPQRYILTSSSPQLSTSCSQLAHHFIFLFLSVSVYFKPRTFPNLALPTIFL